VQCETNSVAIIGSKVEIFYVTEVMPGAIINAGTKIG